MDGSEEVTGGLVVARGKGPELFEFTKEILNPVTLLIQFLIDVTWDLTALFRGNDDFLSGFFQWREEAFVRVEGAVGEHGFRGNGRQKGIGPFQIVRLARCQEKIDGTAQSIGNDMNFGGQPTFRASEGLLCLSGLGVLPPFLRAPAAC
jgi:hypothetical protein